MIGPKVPKPTPAESRAAYKTVKERSGGVCEGCGIRPATDVHHRLYRSRGGHDTVANLLHLCGSESGLPGGNHSGCHGVAHTVIGEQLGWSVKSGNNPSVIPIFHKEDQSWSQDGAPVLGVTAMELMAAFGQIRSGL